MVFYKNKTTPKSDVRGQRDRLHRMPLGMLGDADDQITDLIWIEGYAYYEPISIFI